ncbi:hypothetical protein Tco_0893809 [Tanacetum coccineum]|uniref:Uncharacterized protein n=1 Tax=Tanacetum coccineum TaxID=301880 RepID=A0ABQ5CBG1_9ASTR
MQKNLSVLIKPKWNATTATKQGILQESVEQRKITEGGWMNHGNKEGSKLERKKSLSIGDIDEKVVPSCSNECKESYANLKRLYDAQREQLSDASVEIKAYTQGLKKVEAQYSGILSYENEDLQSVFKINKSDFENPPLHKRLVKTCEMQAVRSPHHRQ